MKSCKKFKFKKAAEKFLKSRTRKEQVRLLAKIYDLPQGEHIKKLEGYENCYRLRVGDFRVIYELHHDEMLIITISDIGNRGDVYK